MAIAYSYPTAAPELQDLLIGTEMAEQGGEGSPKTRTFTVGSIVDLANGGVIGPEGPQGPTGAQGIQGITGTAGAVGPAGLTWRGAWASGTSYVANDAVGHSGASWFCILATSGTTTPNLATANWALLASQGAPGIQGEQGPTGAQGPAGAQVTKVLKTTITSAQVFQLSTTPITVLPAASSGKINIPTNIYIKRNAGTAYTLYNSLALLDNLNIDTNTQINPNPLSNTTVGFMNNSIYLSENASGNTTNAPYKLKVLDGNPTGGTGDLDVYVTYVEITL